MRAQYKGINVKDLVKYPHGQHREGGVDNVEECDEVLIVYGLQKHTHKQSYNHDCNPLQYAFIITSTL